VFITAGHPRQSRAGECVEITLPGTVSLLCADEEGHLHGEQQHWEGQTSVPADRAVEMLCAGVELQTPVWERSGEALTLRQEAQVQLRSNLRGSVGAVSGLTLGEPKPKTRCPSLILKRAEAASLWETAKQCGSTVDAILEANGLTQEPEPGVMLLIPIQ